MPTASARPDALSKSHSIFPVRVLEKFGGPESPFAQDLILSTAANGRSEVILDYGRAEGGMPFFEISSVEGLAGPVSIEAIYSETSAGLEKETGW